MARTGKLILLFVPWNSTTKVRANGCENAKPSLAVFRYVNRFFRYRFSPAVHLPYLNRAHHGFGQGRELADFAHRGIFEFGCVAQQWKKGEADEWHRKQGAYKNRAKPQQCTEKRAPILERQCRWCRLKWCRGFR